MGTRERTTLNPLLSFPTFFSRRLRLATVQDMGVDLCDAMLMVTRALLTVTPVREKGMLLLHYYFINYRTTTFYNHRILPPQFIAPGHQLNERC